MDNNRLHNSICCSFYISYLTFQPKW